MEKEPKRKTRKQIKKNEKQVSDFFKQCKTMADPYEAEIF